MSALRVRDLSFSHPSGFSVGPLAFELAVGSCTALVGRSGAGKSTLLRLIAGLEVPRAGVISIDGATAFDGKERIAAHARSIGFVFQGGALWPHLDAIEHLRFCAPKRPHAEIAALLDRVGLGGKHARKPAELSGGEQQRLAIARALVSRPKVLLLDEPLRSLDVHLRPEIAILVRELAQESGATLLTVTHDRDEALLLAEDAIVLEQGRIAESGPIVRLEREPQTAHAAALLAGATCFDVAIDRGSRTAETPFGRIDLTTAMSGAGALAILPGDLRIASELASTGMPGTVIAVESVAVDGALTSRIHVAAHSRRFVVGHERPLSIGTRVQLVPARALRVLPWSLEVKS